MSTHDVAIGADLVVKTYRPFSRDEPEREWSALRLLEPHAPGLAPRPLTLRGPPWVLTMSRVPGVVHNRERPLSAQQMLLLGAAFTRLWSVPGSLWSHLPARNMSTRDVVTVVAVTLEGAQSPRATVLADALDLLRQWLVSPDVEVLRMPCPEEVFGRGDSNLDNVLWSPQAACLVDFEDSGRSCRAYELAELVEHLGSRGTPDREWLDFAARHVDGCHARLLAARRAFAAFWLLLLLPGGGSHDRNPPGTAERQAQRLAHLLDVP